MDIPLANIKNLHALWLLCIISLCCTMMHAQSPYTLAYKVDLPILGVSVINYTTSTLLDKKNRPLTETQLALLNPMDINPFDRPAAYNSSSRAELTSDVLMWGSTALPFLFLADKKIRSDAPTIISMCLESFVLNQSFTQLNKTFFHRKRPYTYNPEFSLSQRTSKDGVHSFFSGHTSYVATFSFFSAAVYQRYHPYSKGRYAVWAGAALLPAITGIMRVRAGKHYWTDVIAGYASGLLVGLLVPRLHHTKNK
jgi:hypothetical protein